MKNHILICAECERKLHPDTSIPKWIAENTLMRVCMDCYIFGNPHYPPATDAKKV